MRGWRCVTLTFAALLAGASSAGAASDPGRPLQWGLDMIEADAAHQLTAGSGAVIAVVDSGVQADHPDLAGRLLGGHDFVQDDDIPQDETADGHGTHVTGIIVANTGNGVGVASVAPAAQVLPVRVLGADGGGDASSAAAGIDYAVSRHVDVINLSFGSEAPLVGPGSDLNAAIERALDAGIVVVAAAGNNSLPVCEQPAGQGRLLCVGAVDRFGNHAFYSDYGSGLAISAPGGSAIPGDQDILSTVPPGQYAYLAGTSQAAPHVAGVAALLASLGVRGQAAVQRILQTARDAGPPGPDAIYGAGIVDARAAVAGLSPAGGRTSGGSTTGLPAGSRLGSGARIVVAKLLHVRDVLRNGIRVRCTAAGRGRCSVGVRFGRSTLASAWRPVRAGIPVTVTARLNRAGRRLVSGRRRTRLALRIALPGAPVQLRTLTVVR